MTENKRNMLVGVTVLAGAVMLGIMIVLFTMTPGALRGGYTVKIVSDSSHDVQAGHHIYLAGIRVGVITDIGFTDGRNPAGGVTMTARINKNIRLPVDSKVMIYTKGIVGSPYVDIKSPMAANGGATNFLPTDGSALVTAEHVGADFLSPEMKSTLDEIRASFAQIGQLASNINNMIAPSEPSDAQTQGDEQVRLNDTIVKLNKALDDISYVFGDPRNRENYRQTLENLALASKDAPRAAAAFTELIVEARAAVARTDAGMAQITPKLIAAAEGMADLMAQFNRLATSMNDGEGSMGRMINDPALYNNLVDASMQLNDLLREFRVLVDGWQRQGMGVKLK